MSGINKLPVSTLQRPEAIAVGKLGLAGDEQADPTVHGGLAKAIYAYPLEHYPFWQQACQQHGSRHAGSTLHHGMLGENLTISGLLEQMPTWAMCWNLPIADCRLPSRASPASSFRRTWTCAWR
jgi:MOSC domain-containing protein YiiM